MAGVGQDVFRGNAKFLLQLRPQLWQVVVRDPPNFADRDRVDGDQHCGCRAGFQHERFDVQRIIDRARPIRDVDLGGACQELGRTSSLSRK